MDQPPGLVRPPQQERSRQSLQRALDAAVDVLATEGWAGFSVPAVSRRASVSVPLLYRRFGTKDGLFLAAQAHGLRSTQRLIAERLGSSTPGGPEGAVQAAVSAIAEVFAVHGPFLRAPPASRAAATRGRHLQRHGRLRPGTQRRRDGDVR